MNVLFPTPFGEFEWDSQKGAINLKKHGMAFADAVRVFQDPMYLDIYDTDSSQLDEDRFLATGRSHGCIVAVLIYTERESGRRVISTLHASNEERWSYYENTGTDWERLKSMSDEEIYLNALSDPDNPPLETMKSPVITRMRDVPGETLAEKYQKLRRQRELIMARKQENQSCFGPKP